MVAPVLFAVATTVDAYLSLWFRKLPLWPSYFYWELVSSYLWLFFVPLIYHLTRRFPVKKGALIRNGLIHFLAATFISVVHLHVNFALGNFVINLLRYPSSALDLTELVNILYRISWRLLIYLVIAIVCHGFAFYQRLRQEELKTQRLESELAHARLNALKIRLNPEMIFRSFQQISSAMDQDLKKATQMIVSLGDYLRSRLKDRDVVATSNEARMQTREPDAESEKIVEQLDDTNSTRQPLSGIDWKWLSIAWIAIGIFFTARTAMLRSSQGASLSIISVLFMNAPWMLWAFVTPRLLRFYDRYPLEGNLFLKNFVIHILVGSCFWIITISLGFVTQALINRVEGKQSNALLLEMINMGFAKHLVTYWSFVFFLRANQYYRRFLKHRLAISELEFQLTSAQLQALKMQLHPHFLFNALHSLMGLIHEDPVAARRMLLQLQQFFQMTLQDLASQKISLERELEFLRCYLDIEKVRFQDRLNVTVDVDPKVMKHEVPNLILQPLVENAVKHGVSHRSERGEILIQAGSSEDTLQLIVSDNGTGIATRPSAPIKEGVGLSNTRERLQRIYGASHRFLVDRLSGGGFRVLIEIPI